MSSAIGPLHRRLQSLEAAQREEAKPRAKRFRPSSLRAFVESVQIEDKVSGRLIPFKLWPAQAKALRVMAASDRLFGLKARQLGMTWLDLAYWLYHTQYAGNRLILVARQSMDEATDAIHRVRVMHASLPSAMRPQKIVRDNVQSIAFANDSRFEALTATRRIGRGRAAYGGLADEAAFWDFPSQQLVALDAACERLHLLTTGNGPGDAVHKIWQQAQSAKGRWRPLFLAWNDHPDRDEEWYRLNVLEAPEPRLARREYAATADDAFAAPEGVFFERWDSLRNIAKAEDKLPVETWQTERAVDFGYRHPACLWIQTSPQGQSFVVAELVPENLTTEQFVAAIRSTEAGLGIHPTVIGSTFCDPAGRGVQSQTSETEFDIFARNGLSPTCKPSGIRDGCMKIMSLLADPVLPLVVSRSCPWLIEALGSVKPDKHRPDLYDEESDYTHALDALRYWAINHGDSITSKRTGRRKRIPTDRWRVSMAASGKPPR